MATKKVQGRPATKKPAAKKLATKKPAAKSTKAATLPKPPKTKPPNVAVRAGSEGERVISIAWPDGAKLELSARTDGEWHVLSSYPDRSLVLDRVEVLPEEP